MVWRVTTNGEQIEVEASNWIAAYTKARRLARERGLTLTDRVECVARTREEVARLRAAQNAITTAALSDTPTHFYWEQVAPDKCAWHWATYLCTLTAHPNPADPQCRPLEQLAGILQRLAGICVLLVDFEGNTAPLAPNSIKKHRAVHCVLRVCEAGYKCYYSQSILWKVGTFYSNKINQL